MSGGPDLPKCDILVSLSEFVSAREESYEEEGKRDQGLGVGFGIRGVEDERIGISFASMPLTMELITSS